MEATNVHGEQTGLYEIPSRILVATLLKDPEKKSDGEVDVILEMPDEVTGTNVVENTKPIAPHSEQVPNSAGGSTPMNDTRIFCEPHRQVGVTGEGIFDEEVDNIA